MQLKAAVLLMAFNRPSQTREIMQAIRIARPERLYIAADGPRNEQEKDLCEETRKAAMEINWPCDVKTLFQEKNLGCRHGPITAINWFFSQEPEGIILEDDLVPVPSFFRFCAAMLDRYRQDPRIGMISGICPWDVQTDKGVSYHFSTVPKMLGWATWGERWQKYYDQSGDRYRGQFTVIKKQRPLINKYSEWWWRNLEITINHGLDAWDFQWDLSLFANNLLVVRPKFNLVKYNGTGDDATHSFSIPLAYTKTKDLTEHLAHPPAVIWDKKADILFETHLAGGNCFKRAARFPMRVINYIGRRIGIVPQPKISDSYARILRTKDDNACKP